MYSLFRNTWTGVWCSKIVKICPIYFILKYVRDLIMGFVKNNFSSVGRALMQISARGLTQQWWVGAEKLSEMDCTCKEPQESVASTFAVRFWIVLNLCNNFIIGRMIISFIARTLELLFDMTFSKANCAWCQQSQTCKKQLWKVAKRAKKRTCGRDFWLIAGTQVVDNAKFV